MKDQRLIEKVKHLVFYVFRIKKQAFSIRLEVNIRQTDKKFQNEMGLPTDTV